MKTHQIIATQKRVGADPDGFWGPMSTRAAQAHLQRMMPNPHPFPRQRDVAKFYGIPGDVDRRKISIPFPIYYEDKAVQELSPHTLCADSLVRVFARLEAAYPTEDDRQAAGITVYDGLYNPRKMRGGSAWSMHAWAIAIDLNAAKNGNRDHWPTRSSMPIEVMECFAQEGWTAAGAFWSRDAMHFQATQP